MGIGKGMAQAWMRVIREGYLARQRQAHLSKNCWNYLGKRIHQHHQQQKGRGRKPKTKRRRKLYS